MVVDIRPGTGEGGWGILRVRISADDQRQRHILWKVTVRQQIRKLQAGLPGTQRNFPSIKFQARGLNFMMMVGKLIPDVLRTSCCITGADRRIIARSCEDKVAEATRNLLKGRTPVWK